MIRQGDAASHGPSLFETQIRDHIVLPTHARRFLQSICCTRKKSLGGLELATSTLVDFEAIYTTGITGLLLTTLQKK